MRHVGVDGNNIDPATANRLERGLQFILGNRKISVDDGAQGRGTTVRVALPIYGR